MRILDRAVPAVLFLLCSTLAACSESATAPQPEAVPEVVLIPVADISGFDTDEHKVSCFALLDGGSACPVVRWDGVDYVGLSFRDNRFSMAIYAFGAGGSVLGFREHTGARYLEAAILDDVARTVTFVGQGANTIALTWDELKSIH
jgi:hypothetical protein